jgi:peptidyl-prolyl cis-trans isomerase A (cyclophilin A)
MLTTQGEIVLELYPEKAPKTVENFLKYVNDGFYTNTLYHRIRPNFVVQGGGFNQGPPPSRKTATYAPIALEVSPDLRNLRGTIAMARTSKPDSATTEFFFNLVDNVLGGVVPAPPSGGASYPASNLDPDPTASGKTGYAVFGKVIAGLDVVDKIAAVTTQVGTDGVPQDNVLTYWAQQLK